MYESREKSCVGSRNPWHDVIMTASQGTPDHVGTNEAKTYEYMYMYLHGTVTIVPSLIIH